MSVSHTEAAVRDRSKTVTRRLGWRMLKAGDRLTLCRKVMGRTPGEPLERIFDVEVVDVRRERLDAITAEDVAREGFAGDPPWYFVAWYAARFGIRPDAEVTRIEWRYVS
jgi:hypothetical protein